MRKPVTSYITRLVTLSCLVLVSCLWAAGQAVSLQLRTKTGRTEFHQGEIILLDLVFATSAPSTYRVNGAVNLPEYYPMPDTFVVEPNAGWADPLDDYRKALFKAERSGQIPIARSVLSAANILGPQPYVLPMILNDYVRFSRPGRYTLQIQSSRLSTVTPERTTLTLTSNPIDLTILPADPPWQQNQFRSAVDSLAKLKDAIDSRARSYQSTLADSCVILRALGTREAGTAMVDAFRDEGLFSTCSFQAGILEYPDQKFIFERLLERFKDPKFPVSYAFFNMMAMVSVLAEKHPEKLFGPSRERIDRRLEQQLLSLVSLKQEDAKTAAINTLVGTCYAAYGGAMGELAHVPREPSRLNARVLQIANTNFERLSPSARTTLRNYLKAHGLQLRGDEP